MAMSTLETGPKLDWTRDNQMYERYRIWRKKVEFHSIYITFSNGLLTNNSTFIILKKSKMGLPEHWNPLPS